MRVPAIRLPASRSARSALPWQTIAASLDGDTSVALSAFVHGRQRCPRTIANRVAELRDALGALEGATHYATGSSRCTGVPAEKHDAFLARGVKASHVAGSSIPGQLAHAERARRQLVPERRSARDARGARLHGLGSDERDLHPRRGGTRTLCIPAAYMSWKGPCARRQDAAPPLARRRSSRGSPRSSNVVGNDQACTRIVATLGPSRSTSSSTRRSSRCAPTCR